MYPMQTFKHFKEYLVVTKKLIVPKKKKKKKLTKLYKKQSVYINIYIHISQRYFLNT